MPAAASTQNGLDLQSSQKQHSENFNDTNAVVCSSVETSTQLHMAQPLSTGMGGAGDGSPTAGSDSTTATLVLNNCISGGKALEVRLWPPPVSLLMFYRFC